MRYLNRRNIKIEEQWDNEIVGYQDRGIVVYTDRVSAKFNSHYYIYINDFFFFNRRQHYTILPKEYLVVLQHYREFFDLKKKNIGTKSLDNFNEATKNEFAINIEEYKSAISNFFNEKLNCPPLNNVAYHAKLENRMWKKNGIMYSPNCFQMGK